MENQDKNILITGGLGYIGSHVVVNLLEERSYKSIIIVDNLSNSWLQVLDGIKSWVESTQTTIIFEELDCCDLSALDKKIFSQYDIHEIIHLAGSKSVSESISAPLMYYENNLMSTINLLKLVDKHKDMCSAFIVSSTAAVYSEEYFEDSEAKAETPYGRSKLMIEQILQDYANTNSQIGGPGRSSIVCMAFRYFNPIGAHPSGKIGENPDNPSNIMPNLQEVATGKREKFFVFGSDYETRDGTCEKDYIHVMDVAGAHLKGLDYISDTSEKTSNFEIFNIWTGKITSVLELLAAYEEATGKEIPYELTDRREGDTKLSKGSTEKAKRILNFEAKYSVEQACKDSWNWIKAFDKNWRNSEE